MADDDAELAVREGSTHEVEEHIAVVAPIGVARLSCLEQISGKIQWRPRAAVRGRLVIFEELRKQGAVDVGARDLITRDPVP